MTLRELRFRHRLTQFDVAKGAFMSPSKVSLIERGYIQPNRVDRERIAAAFGLAPEEIDWEAERMEGCGQ